MKKLKIKVYYKPSAEKRYFNGVEVNGYDSMGYRLVINGKIYGNETLITPNESAKIEDNLEVDQ